MKHPGRTCDSDYVCLPQLAFRPLTYAQSTSLRSSPLRKIFPSPCIVRSLFMTTRRLLAQLATPLISFGCLVVIVVYCITWSPLLANQCQAISAMSNYGMRTPMIKPLDCCGLDIVGTLPRAGMHFPYRTPGGSPAVRREDTKYIMTY
jgi:hypothetical protein